MNSYKIILAPNAGLAKTVCADASIEAEYGDVCVEGNEITLAHHGSRSGNPAPCNAEVEPLDGGTILVSHIDLDTVGGIMAVEGRKPEDPEFWKAAEYVDVNGPHRIHSLPEGIRDKLNAYYAAEYELREMEGFPPRDALTDVTEHVEKRTAVVKSVLDGDAAYIERGKAWAKSVSDEVEARLVCETGLVRVFVTDGPFTAASYYSPADGKVRKATVTFNLTTLAITVAFEDGGKAASAKDVVQKLWGAEAGGRDGIAGSPRGRKMCVYDIAEAVRETHCALGSFLSDDWVSTNVIRAIDEALNKA